MPNLVSPTSEFGHFSVDLLKIGLYIDWKMSPFFSQPFLLRLVEL